MADCLFCKIIRREIPATLVYEDERVLAFYDINPQAPTHVLAIPRQHIASAHELGPEYGSLLSALFDALRATADAEGLADGYRIVTNVGPAAGQSVDHLHFHLLGGRRLSWPPG
jgi:histidine triad (HIT) family protein